MRTNEQEAAREEAERLFLRTLGAAYRRTRSEGKETEKRRETIIFTYSKN